MKFYFAALTIVLMTLFWQSVNTSELDFVEDESGLVKQEDDSRHHQWQRCWQHRDCKAGFYCRGRWCYPKYSCSIQQHCPANYYCDVRQRVCLPGQAGKCTSHQQCGYYKYCKGGLCVNKECYIYHGKRCRYGYDCHSPGVCKLRHGFCNEENHCKSDQCCLKQYGHHYAGICKPHPTANQWCDTKGRATCPCADGYKCEHRWWHYDRCVVAPTLPPTEEPGSGDIES